MSNCPCCSNLLLQHIRGSEVYWFCRHCWQEMPVLVGKNSSSLLEDVVEDLPKILAHSKKTSGEFSTSQRRSRSGWIGVQNISA